ncbi:unnamed protein product [Umbelopsis ramanniana]
MQELGASVNHKAELLFPIHAPHSDAAGGYPPYLNVCVAGGIGGSRGFHDAQRRHSQNKTTRSGTASSDEVP